MVLSLLLQVSEEAKKAAQGKGEEVVGSKVKEGLQKHLVQLGEHTEKLRKDLAVEEKEQKKHITSEDMHDGFDSKVSPRFYSYNISLTISSRSTSQPHPNQHPSRTQKWTPNKKQKPRPKPPKLKS
jgi:hypothetical protein